MVDLVEEGYDVAIRVTEPADSTLALRRLAPAPVLVVAAPSYLARRGTPTHPSQLRQHDCLIDTNHHDHPRWRFRVDGRELTVAVAGPVHVNSPLAVRDLACVGEGFAQHRDLAAPAGSAALPSGLSPA